VSFTDTQLDALKAPLNRQNVRSRQQAGRSLSYIEGWHTIAEANRIFGFDAWHRETVELRECGEPRQTGDKWRVAFICRVRVTVQAGGKTIVRDGTGYGSGIDKDLGQAYESAVKEAETDAMKRGLMTFGNPFGLALYDKDQANVVDGPSPEDESRGRFLDACRRHIGEASDPVALRQWWASDDQKRARRDFSLTQDEVDSLKTAFGDRLQQLAPRAVG
jgi:DNA repair and recombination protein RAD52